MADSIVDLSMAGWLSTGIGVVAQLGVADVLENGPLNGEDLAAKLGVRTDELTALLRALTTVNVFAFDEEGRFANSELSEQLRTTHPMTMRHMCMLLSGFYAQSCEGLLTTLRTGESALEARFGVSIYDYLLQDSETARVFDIAMQDAATPIASAVAEHYPFEGVRTVVDVGGGNGELLKVVLAAHPELNGICVDRPDTCKRAEAALAESGNTDLQRRLSYAPSSIFESIPSGGDLYIIKNVLHDWTTESSIQILSTISAAMRASADEGHQPKLLILDPVEEYDAHADTRPLIKMVIGENKTRSRTEADIYRETAAAGLKIVNITPIPTDLAAISCTID